MVIPVYDEPDLFKTLNCLTQATPPACAVEVILVLNSACDAPIPVIEQNKKTLANFNDWNKNNNRESICFYILNKMNNPVRIAGAGLARKIGMDEAVNRFFMLGNSDGIIVSLDADALVEDNYFTEIERFFGDPSINGCSLYFEHQINEEMDKKLKTAIIQYELYLRYFVEALRFINFPYAFHTIGSCFAVRVDAYCKQGGMNKRKAGEDFYFLQKLFQLGNYKELNSTTVFPGVRKSKRVPFGTGQSIVNITERSSGSLLNVYAFTAFLPLKYIYGNIQKLYSDNFPVDEFISQIKEFSLKEYLLNKEFKKKVEELRFNTSHFSAFEKRFYSRFNNFFIIQYLNYAHKKDYQKVYVVLALKNLLTQRGDFKGDMDDYSLLRFMRNMQKTGTNC